MTSRWIDGAAGSRDDDEGLWKEEALIEDLRVAGWVRATEQGS